MRIRLSDHFTLGRLLRFAIPSVVMMVFTSIYGADNKLSLPIKNLQTNFRLQIF